MKDLTVTQDQIERSIKSVGKTFNTKPFLELMEKFELQVDMMKEDSKKIQVVGPGTEVKSITMATTAKKLNKVINDARMAAKRPYLDMNQTIDGMIRPVQKSLDSIEEGERRKCKAYRNIVLQKQIEAEKEAAAAKPMKSFGGLNVTKVKPIREAEATVTTIDAGSSSYKKEKVHKLVDITKVPAKYLLLNDKAIKQAIKDGVTAIPGLEIVEEMNMTIRS